MWERRNIDYLFNYFLPEVLFLVQWSGRIALTAWIAQGFFLLSFSVELYTVFVACCLEPMLVAYLPIFFVKFSVLGHSSKSWTIVCVPIDEIHMIHYLQFIHVEVKAKRQTQNCEMGKVTIEWMSGCWRGKMFFSFLTRLIVFFQAVSVYFVMSNLLNTPADCPHTVVIPVCAASKPLLQSSSSFSFCLHCPFHCAFSKSLESSFPSGLCSVLFPLLCLLTCLITALQGTVCFFLFFSMRPSEGFTC